MLIFPTHLTNGKWKLEKRNLRSVEGQACNLKLSALQCIINELHLSANVSADRNVSELCFEVHVAQLVINTYSLTVDPSFHFNETALWISFFQNYLFYYMQNNSTFPNRDIMNAVISAFSKMSKRNVQQNVLNKLNTMHDVMSIF